MLAPKNGRPGIFAALARLWLARKPDLWFDDPVLICASVEELLSASRTWPGIQELPRQLAEVVAKGSLKPQLASGSGFRTPDRDAFRDALCRPNKLLLLVYDRQSKELWSRRGDTWRPLLGCLRALQEGAQTGDSYRWEQQHLLMVFSDLHHAYGAARPREHRLAGPQRRAPGFGDAWARRRE